MYRSKPKPNLRPNPRLSDRGREILDPQSEVAPVGLRPLTDFERIQRLAAFGQRMNNFLPDDEFEDEDDFHDHLDDLPPEGLTPYEISELRQNLIRKVTEKKKPSSATPEPKLQNSEPVAPQIAKGKPSTDGD